ncbi:hypothetical protein HHK36_020398 [Tetracentron sinense]|uniref:Uncharacterized protein n=1 Tax=Tetracentron sinense TaxID=13715 RepID=A0A834YYX8_TETSI|nr:hypothetical protein HHK36_020398 [Tetracentron sinense]
MRAFSRFLYFRVSVVLDLELQEPCEIENYLESEVIMAESPKNRRSSSSSSDEEIVGGDGSGVELENREASGGIGTNNDGIIDRSLPREKTLPAETSNADKLESTSNGHKLETSKTVRRRHNIVGEEAAQIFDDRISVQKKLRIA